MKFLPDNTQISSCPSPSWASLCGARDTLGPFHRLSLRYSIHRSRPPKSVGPSISCLAQGTPFGEGGKNGLSTFSPDYMYSGAADIQHTCGCGHCPQRSSRYGRFQNCKSEPKYHGNEAVHRPAIHCSDILSPKPYDNLNYLLNGKSYDIQLFKKTKIFIETKVVAMKFQVLTINLKIK